MKKNSSYLFIISAFLVLFVNSDVFPQTSYLGYLQKMPVYISSCLDIQEDLIKPRIADLYTEITADISKHYFSLESSDLQSKLRKDISGNISLEFNSLKDEVDAISLSADSFYNDKIHPLESKIKDSSKMTSNEIDYLQDSIATIKYKYCEKFNKQYSEIVDKSWKVLIKRVEEIQNNNNFELEEKRLLQISALRSHLYLLMDLRKFNIMTTGEKMLKMLY